MQFYKYILLLVGLAWSQLAYSQSYFSGQLVNGQGEAIISATIHWQDSASIGAVTDFEGKFRILRLDTVQPHTLEIRHLSYEPVSVEILPSEQDLILTVGDDLLLEQATVEVTAKQGDAFASTINPINVETLGQCELRRAACCSLAESFENNGTVNVSFTDAVTGARDIEMLGLRGIYSQLMIENRPNFNRLGLAYGLEYIPGTFVESIQISKGASTVRNGVEGLTGQINTELIKPHNAPKLYLNGFLNHLGRSELNLNLAHKFNERTATGLLLHGNYFNQAIDHNGDNFMDIPLKRQLNALWRLNHRTKNLHAEINAQAILDQREGGQVANFFSAADLPQRLYQIDSDIERYEVFGKLGFIGFDNPLQSLALIYSLSQHNQSSSFGDRLYEGKQNTAYLNLLFQTPLGKGQELMAGFNYRLDDFQEQVNELNMDRREQQSALFAEYNWQQELDPETGRGFGLIAGLRLDQVQTLNGMQYLPTGRLNFKYNFNQDFIIRASGGRGIRLPNLLIENFRYLPSSRAFILNETPAVEKAWNYGLNITRNYILGERAGSLSLDVYRTDFEQRLVADIDHSSSQVQFYNLDGRSFANSILLSWTQDLIENLELRLAYKYNDVYTTHHGQLTWMAFSPRHRGLMALQYQLPKSGWQFNLNSQLVGPQRLPTLYGDLSNLPAYRQEALSPTFALLNAQVSKKLGKGWEVYLGGENLTNYRQEQPILGAQDPFGQNLQPQLFDASAVYAPVFGTMVYAGFRYTLGEKTKADPHAGHHHGPNEGHHATKEHHHENGAELLIKSDPQCGMCQTTISQGLEQIEGVYHASVDLNSKTVEIHYDEEKTNPAALRKALSQLGYPADELPADPKAHDQLPACCQQH